MIDGGTAIARRQLVESDGVDIGRVDPAMQIAGSRVLGGLDSAAESHGEAHIAAGGFPHIAQAQPAARHLALSAVGADDLRENAVVIANAVADGRGSAAWPGNPGNRPPGGPSRRYPIRDRPPARQRRSRSWPMSRKAARASCSRPPSRPDNAFTKDRPGRYSTEK